MNYLLNEFKNYASLIRFYWLTKKSIYSWMLFLAALGFTWFIVYLSVYMNQLNADLYNFVENKDKIGLISNIKVYSIIALFYISAITIKSLLVSLTTFRWRKFLTEKVISRWLDDKKYHHVKSQIDNPDQRISEDVNYFCTKFMEVLFKFLINAGNFIAFIGVLWSFPYSFDFNLFGHDFSIPHYLAIGCFFYAVIANYLLVLIGRPIVKIDYEKERKEADFRSTLMRINSHSEEVAFANGEKVENAICNDKFTKIRDNYYALVKRTFSVDLFNNGYELAILLLPMIAAFPLFFADKISFGELMQISGAAASVLVAFGVIISNFQLMASLQAAKNRLMRFLTALDSIEKERQIDLERVSTHREKVTFSEVNYIHDSGKILLEDLNLEIPLGKKLLILGQSGIGKTSLLRMLAKIWIPTEGRLTLPEEPMYFVPQRPYLPVGSLQQCLNYPHATHASEDDVIVAEVLNSVGLGHLIEYLDEEKDFLKELSLGELQRLNFARIFLHRPRILVMDEPTSALDEGYEYQMFNLLKSKIDPDTTIITVSHSQELAKFHDYTVEIKQSEEGKLVVA